MSGDPGERSLLQLKIDYLAFMEQVHGALGFEPNLIAVLFLAGRVRAQTDEYFSRPQEPLRH